MQLVLRCGEEGGIAAADHLKGEVRRGAQCGKGDRLPAGAAGLREHRRRTRCLKFVEQGRDNSACSLDTGGAEGGLSGGSALPTARQGPAVYISLLPPSFCLHMLLMCPGSDLEKQQPVTGQCQVAAAEVWPEQTICKYRCALSNDECQEAERDVVLVVCMFVTCALHLDSSVAR